MIEDQEPGAAASAARQPAYAVATPVAGLTAAQVAERRSGGLGYPTAEPTSRSVAEILRANILTRFNFILGTLLVVILSVGEPQDALFGIVLVANAVIGIAQELRAKRTLDRLAVLTAPTAAVLRDGRGDQDSGRRAGDRRSCPAPLRRPVGGGRGCARGERLAGG